MNGLRKNLWAVATIVLAIALIAVIAYTYSGRSSICGDVVSMDDAADNVVSFINENAQPGGEVELVRSEQEGPLYRVIVNFQGQEVPVYATLDGQYIVSNIIPIGPANESEVDNETGSDDQVEVSADDDPFIGAPNAPVTIIEFSDYQCPFCARFWSQAYQDIKEEYINKGQVKIVFRDFPLESIHPLAIDAAIAAECVNEQGANVGYFEYHDILFERQQNLSADNLKLWAKELGYDIDECLDNREFEDEVRADLEAGADAGVRGTPAFFINGQLIEGAQPFSVFQQAIDAALEGVADSQNNTEAGETNSTNSTN